MTSTRTGAPSADSLGQPLFPGIRPAGTRRPAASATARPGRAAGAAEITAVPAAGPRVIDMPPAVIVEPRPADYAGAARKILRGRNPNVGVVLSVLRILPADGRPMIDTGTVAGPRRPRLAHPPAHVVRPAEVFAVQWKRMTLRYVWILSNAKSVYPVGGMLFLPDPNEVMFHLVTFNVGALDDSRCTNVHHAEMQAVRWVDEQPPPWRARLGGVGISNLSRRAGLGYSPCQACCADLARFLAALRTAAHGLPLGASITWLTTYDRNPACGHPTDTASLRRLAASGWRLSGPGWPPAPGSTKEDGNEHATAISR
jgi:hypothetical protein